MAMPARGPVTATSNDDVAISEMETLSMEEHDSDAVARLWYRHAECEFEYLREVYSGDEFDVGRADIQAEFDITEPTLSTHHVRFHCVTFTDENKWVAPPLVYARVLSSNPVILCHSDVNHPRAKVKLTRASGDILLNQGDTLRLSPKVMIVLEMEGDVGDRGLTDDQRAEANAFAPEYTVYDRVLGTGAHGGVFFAVKRPSYTQLACKLVPHSDEFIGMAMRGGKDLLRQLFIQRKSMLREFLVLQNVSHPNIINLDKVFCTPRSLYIIQELITGGDLLSYMDMKGQLTEPQTVVIVRQILKAVEYLHANGIVHRDLKPENILMTSWKDGARIVLTDFGQARLLGDDKGTGKGSAIFRMQSTCGTHGYTAPEVYRLDKRQRKSPTHGYSRAVDMWSVGCITANLLTSNFVFADEVEDLVNADIEGIGAVAKRLHDLSFMDTCSSWHDVGRKAKSFVRSCLVVDESTRLTAEQALQHTWFTSRHYAAEIEAAYQRAIGDWKPRGTREGLIEEIDTRHIPIVATGKPVTKSHHFGTDDETPALPASGGRLDPALAPLAAVKDRLRTIAEDAREDAQDTTRRGSEARKLSAAVAPIASATQLSIFDYGPPDTLYSLSGTLPPPVPEWESLPLSGLEGTLCRPSVGESNALKRGAGDEDGCVSKMRRI